MFRNTNMHVATKSTKYNQQTPKPFISIIIIKRFHQEQPSSCRGRIRYQRSRRSRNLSRSEILIRVSSSIALLGGGGGDGEGSYRLGPST